jgi:ribosomal protein S6
MTYELTFLLNEEEELKKLKEMLKTVSAKLISEEAWGDTPLAYPIKHHQSAKFYQWRFEAETKDLPELKKKLNFNEKLIRHLLLQVDDESK